MATITQTFEETLTFTAKPPRILKKVQRQTTKSNTKLKQDLKCPPDCKECQNPEVCPPDCEECKKVAKNSPPDCKTCKQENIKLPLFFNTVGILIAILASYLMIATESNLYLVFWVCYSVIRRMVKSKPRVKTE